MSRHSQGRAWSLSRVLGLLIGSAISGIAGAYLALSAIDFAQLARGGESAAWLFGGAASLGAVVCALLVLVLLTRALRSLGIIRDYKPRRAAARKRAK